MALSIFRLVHCAMPDIIISPGLPLTTPQIPLLPLIYTSPTPISTHPTAAITILAFPFASQKTTTQNHKTRLIFITLFCISSVVAISAFHSAYFPPPAVTATPSVPHSIPTPPESEYISSISTNSSSPHPKTP